MIHRVLSEILAHKVVVWEKEKKRKREQEKGNRRFEDKYLRVPHVLAPA